MKTILFLTPAIVCMAAPIDAEARQNRLDWTQKLNDQIERTAKANGLDPEVMSFAAVGDDASELWAFCKVGYGWTKESVRLWRLQQGDDFFFFFFHSFQQ